MSFRVKFLMDHPGYPVGSVTTVTTSGAGLTPGVVEQLERRGIVRREQPQTKQTQRAKSKRSK